MAQAQRAPGPRLVPFRVRTASSSYPSWSELDTGSEGTEPAAAGDTDTRRFGPPMGTRMPVEALKTLVTASAGAWPRAGPR